MSDAAFPAGSVDDLVLSEARFDAMMAERAKRHTETAAASVAREAQDDDFHALVVTIGFQIHGFGGQEFSEDHDPSVWEFSEDGGENSKIAANIVPQVLAALAPLVAHYEALGLVPLSSSRNGPQFCLVYRPDAEGTSPESLAQMPNVMVDLQGQPGATLELSVWSSQLNATAAFEEAGANDVEVGHWGGAAANGLNRQAEETRGDWLARVIMPGRTIERSAERWKRSGGNLKLFGLFGSAGERAVGDQPIEWIIPGLYPRGYVSVLAGPKQGGKSTLLGEMAAVIDSECQSPRSVLGIDVIERGVSAIVSGEDGDNFINRRADFYTETHGAPLGLVIDISRIPWPEALRLLHQAPRLDFLGIDPLRAILKGDEDSSGVISAMFDDLNELARLKNCAIVLTHHTSKKTPKSFSGMLDALRGSGVITDRPRVVTCLMNRGSGVVGFGVIKRNVPPSEALWGEVGVEHFFRQDTATLTLVPVAAHAARSEDDGLAGEVLELIHAAIVQENSLGNVLRRTGKAELFERRLPHLAGVSRHMARDGVATLLAAGRLIDGPEGLMAVGTAPLGLGT